MTTFTVDSGPPRIGKTTRAALVKPKAKPRRKVIKAVKPLGLINRVGG